MTKIKKTLIVETLSDGHRKEYIEHLFDYINTGTEAKNNYIFFLNEKLIADIDISCDNLQIIPLKKKYFAKKPLYRNLVYYFLIRKILVSYPEIQRVLFLNFDIYQPMLCISFFTGRKLEYTGILFQPFHQIPIESIKSYFRVTIKKVLMNVLLFMNTNISKIFILNDESGADFLNKNLRSSKKHIFSYLPDPIDTRITLDDDNKINIYEKFGADKNRKILLVFGNIDFRKNIFNIIDALTQLSEDIQASVCLLVTGQIHLSNSFQLFDKIKKTNDDYPQLQIILKEGRTTDFEREELFSGCDVVLMPYLKFYGSSGVLGHAVKYKKPVIASDTRLMKLMIEKYQLGVCVKSDNSSEIKNGILALINQPATLSRSSKNNEFISSHRPSEFSKILLN